jgi:hypothetical protein
MTWPRPVAALWDELEAVRARVLKEAGLHLAQIRAVRAAPGFPSP